VILGAYFRLAPRAVELLHALAVQGLLEVWMRSKRLGWLVLGVIWACAPAAKPGIKAPPAGQPGGAIVAVADKGGRGSGMRFNNVLDPQSLDLSQFRVEPAARLSHALSHLRHRRRRARAFWSRREYAHRAQAVDGAPLRAALSQLW
jgi:hypothetical protein